MLNALDTTKACGPDGITGKMLKMTASSITHVLTKLFNLSIATDTVPTAWKTSTIVPVPKCSANTSYPSNYRPISLLSICDKMLEWHISHLLISFLASSCPLSSSQWGFYIKEIYGNCAAFSPAWLALIPWKGNWPLCSFFLTFEKLLIRFPPIPCSVN